MLLTNGCIGEDVRQLQEQLIALGYSCGSSCADGTFGQATYNAVVKFQTEHGLSGDGIVGPNTWTALNSAIGSSTNLALLKKGSIGTDVMRLQQKLNSLGYSCGTADGDFGTATYNAVVTFQTSHGLSADGIVGANTWTVLNSTTGGSSNSSLLKQGCNGADVRQLQERLISLGYSCGSSGADSDFGQGTYNAVIQFQADNRLSADGIVGAATWAALNSATGSPSSSTLLKKGNTGEAVRVLQEKLNSLGYSCGVADGDFGTATYNAVVTFQTSHGLSADGIVGPATWASLNSASGSANYSTLLRQGSTGDSVFQLQTKLNSLGYSCGVADGDFGTATYNAVVTFQTSHGLSVDGIVGPTTWASLNSQQGGAGAIVIGGPGINKFIAVAKNELAKGFAEYQGNNMTPYGAWYGMNGQPWCAMFVSWCANQAGIIGSIVPMYAYCPFGVKWYANKGRYRFPIMGYTPKEGDVVFYKENGVSCHTGIVIGCNASTHMITTIEGNESDAVRKVERSYLNNSYIDGFGDNGGPTAIITHNDMNIFELYETESHNGFANLFNINLSQRIEQNIINTPNLKVDFSAKLAYSAGDGAITASIANGKISGMAKCEMSENIFATLAPNKMASITARLAKVGNGDLLLTYNFGFDGTPHLSGTLSYHNKIGGYNFYQNIDFSFIMNDNFYLVVAGVASVAAIIAIITLILPEAAGITTFSALALAL